MYCHRAAGRLPPPCTARLEAARLVVSERVALLHVRQERGGHDQRRKAGHHQRHAPPGQRPRRLDDAHRALQLLRVACACHWKALHCVLCNRYDQCRQASSTRHQASGLDDPHRARKLLRVACAASTHRHMRILFGATLAHTPSSAGQAQAVRTVRLATACRQETPVLQGLLPFKSCACAKQLCSAVKGLRLYGGACGKHATLITVLSVFFQNAV